MLMWTEYQTVAWCTGRENLEAKPASWALKLKVHSTYYNENKEKFSISVRSYSRRAGHEVECQFALRRGEVRISESMSEGNLFALQRQH
ncbi:uncharacterized protein N7503_010098 [Penicillium pulvis]|uniref:uncharacterized protein n=1 Tax=Penicillium pulvis TaxID=1562058 RepID=UPI00254740B1|nr:uncharacterized protein N7503_010098 [Penicillium pulvis]KAJ5784886.1 hypothetical protein N7503_010098 [Penicillium pulvis]